MLVLTTAASRALDRAAQERFGIPGIVLMENAAIGMAAVAKELIVDRPTRRVTIVCGPGNNGGDGYAVARHLANAGATVALVAVGDPKAGSDACVQAGICRAMRLNRRSIDSLADLDADLVVDALFGTGLDRPVAGAPADAILAMNAAGAQGVPILALDLPSGLDGDTGLPLGCAVRATVTAVTVAPRPAMSVAAAAPHIGRHVVVGIGCPAALLREFGTEASDAGVI